MTDNPLIGQPPPEVPLPSAPLVRVIAQVRFGLVVSIEKREFIAGFQEAIREEYAVLRQETASNLLVNVRGQADVEVRTNTVWRFHDLERRWRVTLAADFMALETSHYTSRADFLERFARLLAALEQHVKPGVLDRLGVRYIDRITGAPLEALATYLRPALLGALGTAVREHARVAVSEGLFDLPEEGGQMRARWGVLPANATVDPNAIEPVEERSWVLDIDAFSQGERSFVAGEITQQARALTERIYAFFRWSVTDDFLKYYGGTP
jgi:uncharacterized protein (TIGR04255 family)